MDSRYDWPFVAVSITPESSTTGTSEYSSSTWGTPEDGALYNESLVIAFLAFEKGEYDAFGLPPDVDMDSRYDRPSVVSKTSESSGVNTS